MRLDMFLKLSRLIPRRGLAQEFCDAGLVSVNGLAAKASKDVKTGDEIELRRRDRTTKVRIAKIPASKNIAKGNAAELYEVIQETQVAEDLL